ncbi:MAG TPA: 3-deoxy-D-manno-octulosonic acid kinase [Woeseiaceae bacterium]
MDNTVEKTETGAILYDRAVLNQISDATFVPATWMSAKPVSGYLQSAGRGNTVILSDGQRHFVMRHFRRGGLAARVSQDSYLWLGEDRTRSFTEFRLLAELVSRSLPVPPPVAARYRRTGILYSADIITALVPGIQPLAARILEKADRDFWERMGAGIARFHQAGVNHADLNAYNVQVDRNDEILVLDFDRGRLMQEGSWQQSNLARLQRSLEKIKRLDQRSSFSADAWEALLAGYSAAAGSA